MKLRERLPAYFVRWFDKYKYLLLVCLIGLVLIVLPSGGGQKDQEETTQQNTTAETQVAELEKQMETLFSQIHGVGSVRVLLTVKSSEESVYAYDRNTSTSQNKSGSTQSSQTELITVGSGSNEGPVISKTNMPKFLGAVVVCQGGDQAKVRLQLTEAIRSLTGITADNIVISKMQD